MSTIKFKKGTPSSFYNPTKKKHNVPDVNVSIIVKGIDVKKLAN